MPTPFNHITDTAVWIAGFRALETERPDAAFKDPLAKRLAGERGKEMVAITPNPAQMAFGITIRTTAIDRLIEIAIRHGINTVINLGAGLDTRPYRMQLPVNLKWIEVDFPDMVTNKSSLLAGEKPICDLRRIAIDLSDHTERKKLFAELGREAKTALIITEGVIPYLENSEASQLSKDIFAVSSFKYWIHEYTQGKYRHHKHSKKRVQLLQNTPLLFDVDDPINFFKKDGWEIKEDIHIIDEADRISRKIALSFPWNILIKIFPKKIREAGNKTYGIVMWGRKPESR